MLLATHKCVVYWPVSHARDNCYRKREPCYKPPSEREVDFAKQKTEGACESSLFLELTAAPQNYTHSPSVAFGASSLPDGAFGTKTFYADFLFAFLLSSIAYFEPRDYCVVFFIQKVPE